MDVRRTLVGIVVAAAVAAPARGLAAEAELTPLRDAEGRFLISIPLTWRIDQSRRGPVFSARSPEPSGVSPDTVEVFVRDMLFPLSPEGCASQVAWVMRMTIHEWTTLSEGPDSIGGLAAYTRAYTWHLTSGEERRSIQTCVTMGRRVFVIIGTTMNTPDRIANNLPQLSRIIGTFRPGPAPPPATPDRPQPANER